MIGNLVGRALELVRREGVRGAARKVVERRHRFRGLTRHDPLADLGFVNSKVIEPGSGPGVDLVWFIPPYGRGSGGHTTLFRFVGLLEDRGWTNHICLSGPGHARNEREAERQIREWFPPTKARITLGTNGLPPCRVALATGWQTAYPVRSFQGAQTRAYFVQDFEPWFWPAGGASTLAESTYRFGFPAITMGSWLAGELAQRYGASTFPLGFSYDRSIFSPRTGPKVGAGPLGELDRRAGLRVFFYARPVTPRRGFEIGAMALDALIRQIPDVTVVTAGWGLGNYTLPFPVEDHGVVTPEELADVVRSSDVALVLSHSNVSLLPLEIMACGVPLVTNNEPWSSWLVGPEVAKLAPSEPDAIADALVALCRDPAARWGFAQRGAAFAATTSWGAEADRLAVHLESIAAAATGAPPTKPV